MIRWAVIYLRVSTKHQARPGASSLATQEAECRAYADAERIPEVLHVFCDPGTSGATVNRPGFQAMLSYCETHPVPNGAGVILCQGVDRMGRFADLDEYGYWKFRFRLLGWRWVFLDEEAKLKDPNYNAHLGQLIWMIRDAGNTED